MKNRNILLVSVFIFILAFFLWLSWKNEKRDYEPVTPEQEINIKQPERFETLPYDNVLESKG